MSEPFRHPQGRTCRHPLVLLFVIAAMPYALARLAWDSRPHKSRPPSKPRRKPINTKPIR